MMRIPLGLVGRNSRICRPNRDGFSGRRRRGTGLRGKAQVEQMSEQTNIAAPATAAEIMRPPLTTVEQEGHLAAAAYLMKHAGATALMVLDAWTDLPVGIITETDIVHAAADGKDANSTRIYELMTTRPTVIETTTSVCDAAKVMTSGHFRHLPVVGDAGLVGIIDITDVCRALLEPAFPGCLPE
jgi:CBS domain-containing protein